jgi:hypothetical protein
LSPAGAAILLPAKPLPANAFGAIMNR